MQFWLLTTEDGFETCSIYLEYLNRIEPIRTASDKLGGRFKREEMGQGRSASQRKRRLHA